MPLYEYRCTTCHRLIEVIQAYSDKPLRKCESCGGKLEKQISRSGFVLKGSGWYKSDYNPSSAPASDSDSGTAAASDSAIDSKGAEKKSKDQASKGDAKPGAAAGGKGESKPAAGAPKSASRKSRSRS